MTGFPVPSRQRWLAPVAAAAVTLGIVAAMLAPADRLQGDLARLMYVHVPSVLVAYLSFAITFVASLAWLWTGRPVWDRRAVAAVEVGVFFTGLTLVSGSVWGKPVWGVWWTWDPRLVTTAVLFLVYLAYLSLRRSLDDPEIRAHRAAILGTVAFVQVPIVHLSVVWWRTLHQPATLLKPGDPSMDHTMLAVLLGNIVAFGLVFAHLFRQRSRLAAIEDDLERTSRAPKTPVAGDAVVAPRNVRTADV